MSVVSAASSQQAEGNDQDQYNQNHADRSPRSRTFCGDVSPIGGRPPGRRTVYRHRDFSSPAFQGISKTKSRLGPSSGSNQSFYPESSFLRECRLHHDPFDPPPLALLLATKANSSTPSPLICLFAIHCPPACRYRTSYPERQSPMDWAPFGSPYLYDPKHTGRVHPSSRRRVPPELPRSPQCDQGHEIAISVPKYSYFAAGIIALLSRAYSATGIQSESPSAISPPG